MPNWNSACNRACPIGLNVAESKGTPTGCIACLQCLVSCPHPGALDLSLNSVRARSAK